MEIDVAEFAAQLKAGKGIGGKDGALAPAVECPLELQFTITSLYPTTLQLLHNL